MSMPACRFPSFPLRVVLGLSGKKQLQARPLTLTLTLMLPRVPHPSPDLEECLSVLKQAEQVGAVHMVGCSSNPKAKPSNRPQPGSGVTQTPRIQPCPLLNSICQAAPPLTLHEMASGMGIQVADMTQGGEIQATVRAALDAARGRGEVVVVCGSFMVMHDAKQGMGLSTLPRDPLLLR